jgi:drug/metabolite transporter (DMT)-like permease
MPTTEPDAGGRLTRTLALAGIFGISFSAIFVREAGVSPSTAAFFRAAYAVPVLLVVWLAVRSGDSRPASMRLLAAAAGLFLALDLTLWHRSIDLIGAGLATVLANTQVVFVGVIAWLAFRERPTSLALVTIPIVFVGVALISGLGRSDAFGEDPVGGAALGVASGASYAGFLLVFRASNRALAPPAGPLLDATVGTAVGALAFSFADPDFSLRFVWPEHGWLLALALVAQVAGWLLIAVALPRLPALETSVLLLLQPMLTVIWGWLLFTERLSAVQWAGVALVLGGVAALSLRGSVERPAEAPAEP